MTLPVPSFEELSAAKNLPISVELPPRLSRSWSMRILSSGQRVLKLPRAFAQAPEDIKTILLDWALLERPRLKRLRPAYYAQRRLLESAAHEWLKTHRAAIPKPKQASRIPSYETQGCRWNLAEVRDHINNAYLGGGIETLVRWGRAHSRLSFQTSRQLPDGQMINIVTIAGVYNHPEVPRFAIETIMFHEMLHIAIPPQTGGSRRIIHGRAFKAAERSFPHFEAWQNWLKADLPGIMRKKSRKTAFRLPFLPLRLSLFD